jgi:hypothetical protein
MALFIKQSQIPISRNLQRNPDGRIPLHYFAQVAHEKSTQALVERL